MSPPITHAHGKTEKIQKDLELAGAELHLTNTALDRNLPASAKHGDVGKALVQNMAIEGKVQEAAQDLAAVTELLAEEVAHREKLETKLAAATTAKPR